MSTINSINNATAAEHVEYTERTGVTAQNTTENSELFSEMLSNALRDMQMNAGITANTNLSGMPGSFMPMPGLDQSLEQAIMAASDSGDSNDAMVALLMMMTMMMQSGGGGGESSMMMMQMMAAMIGSMQEQNQNQVRHDFLMSSGGDPFVLDTIDSNVFNRPITATSDTGEAVLPLEWWRPATPAITNAPGQRSPEAYRAIVDQFNVETAERYRPGREGNTYCNIFVWDVTRAMGAELPFYTDSVTGEPRFHPDTQGATYMGARAMCRWLQEHGANYGWHEVDAETAQRHANQGGPAVTSAGSIGHVQMVVPSANGAFDPIRGVAIAQAGRNNFNYTHISSTYNAERLTNNVRYWIHA